MGMPDQKYLMLSRPFAIGAVLLSVIESWLDFEGTQAPTPSENTN
jgi:hypothetical protein